MCERLRRASLQDTKENTGTQMRVNNEKRMSVLLLEPDVSMHTSLKLLLNGSGFKVRSMLGYLGLLDVNEDESVDIVVLSDGLGIAVLPKRRSILGDDGLKLKSS